MVIVRHILVIAMVGILLALGFWQAKRLVWKENLITKIETNLHQAPLLQAPNLEADEYRVLQLTGYFIHDKEIHLANKYYKGNSGFHIVTPFAYLDGPYDSTFDYILVNRGWVEDKHKNRANRPETLIEGEITITGIINKQPDRNRFLPDNRPANNVWYHLDLAQASKTLDIPYLEQNFYLMQVDSKDKYPVDFPKKIELPNNHLQYTITWFLLALLISGMYIYMLRTKYFKS